jgi:O-antigen/teichoic acid export membrane protein
MKRIHQSLLLSALDRYGSLIFFLASTAILARLLTPKEFGICALVSAVTTIAAASFQEFGGANYLVQKPSLSEQNIRTAFTVIFGMSVAFTVALLLLLGVIADFFPQDGIKIAIAVSSLNFLLSPFSMTIGALLLRDLSFGHITRCNLAGNFITAVTSVGLAFKGYSFMAPVIGALAGNITTTLLFVLLYGKFRIFRPSFVGYQEVFHFGAYSSAVVLVNVVYSLSPQLILARVLDFNAVGLYSRASNMTQVFDRLVLQVMNPVIGPAIFAHARAGGDLKRAYLRGIELITALQWPFLLYLALLADPVITLWLGPTWKEIIPLIRMLCMASLALFAAGLVHPVLVAVGRIKDSLRTSLISLPPSLLAIFVASFFGVNAVAASALLALPFQAALANYFVGRQIGMTLGDLARGLLKSGIVAVCSTVGAAIGMSVTLPGFTGPIPELMLSATGALAGWSCGLIATRHPLLEQARSFISSFRLTLRTIHSN